MAMRKIVTAEHVVETEEKMYTELDALQEDKNGVYEPGMAPKAKKNISEGASSDLNSEAPQVSPEDSKDKEPNTPGAKRFAEDDQGLLVGIALTKGATYHFRGIVFKKGEARAVESEIAERLMATGFFEKAAVSVERE